MKINKNEIWKVRSRGFEGTLKILEDIETDKDSFFEATIMEGTKVYINRPSETIGATISFRTTLTTFLDKVEVGIGW